MTEQKHVRPVTVQLDGIVFALQRHGGISVYFRELLQRLRRDAISTLFTLDGTPLQTALPAGGVLTTLARPARLMERYRRCRVPASTAPSVFHSSYYRRSRDASLPTVVTVHDFTYERFATGPRRWLHSAQKFAAIRSAQTVVCISQATRDDLLEFVGLRADQQSHVILNGVSEVFRPLSLPPPERPFVLFVGQRAAYKNFARVLTALTFLPELELRCVGGGVFESAELQHTSLAVRQRVKHLGFIDDEQLNVLYNQALCLVYPSRYEGFGIPVAEAMRAGCPVVSIDCKAVREVGGDAIIVSDDEPEALARAILQTIDSARRAACVANGVAVAARYSWEDTYRATLQVYRELSGVV